MATMNTPQTGKPYKIAELPFGEAALHLLTAAPHACHASPVNFSACWLPCMPHTVCRMTWHKQLFELALHVICHMGFVVTS